MVKEAWPDQSSGHDKPKHLFFKLLLWQTSTQPYSILIVLEGGGQLRWEINSLNHSKCVQTKD